jgi:SP family facilitated glucose transporter-like MFS transporter 1
VWDLFYLILYYILYNYVLHRFYIIIYPFAFQDLAPWIPYISILLIIAFVVAFATGPGSIPWFLVSELFNQSARPLASSIAVTVNWTANFFVGIGFLPLAVSTVSFSYLIIRFFL